MDMCFTNHGVRGWFHSENLFCMYIMYNEHPTITTVTIVPFPDGRSPSSGLGTNGLTEGV